MRIGTSILQIRKEKGLSQEKFGELFHVTRQTVSNWENEKSYPDLHTLVAISDMFEISLDKLLKEDKQMVKTIDQERLYGTYVKHQKTMIDFFTGSGAGLLIACAVNPDAGRRTVTICIGVTLLLIGWLKKSRCDKAVIQYLEKQEKEKTM